MDEDQTLLSEDRCPHSITSGNAPLQKASREDGRHSATDAFKSAGNCDLPGEVDSSLAWKRSLQVPAFAQLHDDSALFNAIEGREIRMIQRAQYPSCALEALHPGQ